MFYTSLGISSCRLGSHCRIWKGDDHRSCFCRCGGSDTKAGLVSEIARTLTFAGNLDDEQRARLVEIADRCPVHRTLSHELKVRTELV